MGYDDIALVVAAGRGVRADADVPKQFAVLGGIPLVARAVDAFGAMPVVVVVGEGQRDQLEAALGDRRVEQVVTGGATRQLSVRAGLEAIAADGGAVRVYIHDAARPLLPPAVLARLRAALDRFAGAVPVLPVVDTLAKGGITLGAVHDRDALVRVQTPQAFRFGEVLAAHRTWADEAATDDAQMLRAAGHEVALVEGHASLDKITHRQDFARAEALLGRATISRTGSGYDVHRLEAGEELWLCGVRVPHDRGLSGHSDADVGLHALTDALLGAAAEGDIGVHFPPSDARWRGAPSHRFVEHAAELIGACGGSIDHVDVTLVCEAPKIGPYRDAMRARIAEILRLPLGRVSLKATTTERLGFTGRGEGIAAMATATVRFPEDQ
jgi:2-C-methyl-D-erythritol 4-phosphate cytidylyltransferase / 2-C-methyl-D-erythritol 2,4-cyclodiphosphate synthase